MIGNFIARGTKGIRDNGGFTLLELLISMFIIVILLSVAVPTYQKSIQQARETVLKENLWQMRRAIDQYAGDKGKYPSTVSDLVTAGYLREVPTDPMTEDNRWDEVMADDPISEDGGQILKDVKSLSDGIDGNGVRYREY